MSFQNLVEAAQTYFPDLQIKFKDQSIFMKLIGFLLFFNKSFMANYTTTIGSTIYYPTEAFVKTRPISAIIVLLHELVHIFDAKKYGKYLFSLLYLMPQILAILALPLLLISWKISLLFLIFALPIPAYFRMYFEKRAYMVSLYTIYKIAPKSLDIYTNDFLNQFKSSAYYFMWPFSNLKKEFEDASNKIMAGERPFDSEIFNIIDDLIAKI